MSAAVAVGAIVAGWDVAQQPRVLPGLTIDQAAAGRSTLVAVVIGVAGGVIVLVPSLVLLFSLFLRGHLDAHGAANSPAREPAGVAAPARAGRVTAFALACLFVGAGSIVLTDSGWAHAVGVLSLFAFAGSTFVRAAGSPDDQG